MRRSYRFLSFFLVCLSLVLVSSCTRTRPLGWGLLLWSSENPAIPSGTVLPVYFKSNLNQVWGAGIPEAYRYSQGADKFEIPIAKLELVGSKKAAEKRAEAFSELALRYAETLQDGLPIRETPDNGARRTYRLKIGEVIKILSKAEGAPAISSTGEPLPGAWYKVLTENGSMGYCFSYRLRFFEHTGGALSITHTVEEQEDPDLDQLLTKTWSPESYGVMLNTRKLDLEELSRHWHFAPGQDTGIARIYLSGIDKSFSYTGIHSEGQRSWRFEGAPLQMRLRSDTTLEVQFIESGGALRTLLFVTLPSSVEDLIVQETARQEALFIKLYTLGPLFNSTNYGTIRFSREGRFTWIGYDFLVPQVIPASGLGSGTVRMGLFLAPELADRYDGALSFHLDNTSRVIHFMYTLDTQGIRIEHIPPANLEGITVTRPSPSPLVIYFFRGTRPLES